MKIIWPWVFGIAICLILILFIFTGASDRQSYWVARAVVPRAIDVSRTEDLTLVRFPCGKRAGSIREANECGFYVWKK
jgi:hypothetical protein